MPRINCALAKTNNEGDAMAVFAHAKGMQSEF
jgi:hypothetical protein